MKLDIHEDAVADLEEIIASNAADGRRIITFIQGLTESSYLLDGMTIHNFGSPLNEPINAKKWHNILRIEQQNIWRLRSYDLEKDGINYRFIYCYYFKDETHHIVAVIPKNEMNYDDPQCPIRKRIIATCRRDFPGN